jgi:Family of unknown function (DUF5985)
MAPALYILSCLTMLLCAILLLRAYSAVRKSLLFWSGICFVGLTVSNVFVIADLLIFPQTDLYIYRLGSTAVAMALLLYGLIWETR